MLVGSRPRLEGSLVEGAVGAGEAGSGSQQSRVLVCGEHDGGDERGGEA